MNSWVFISLVIAHIAGDFYFQNDKCCKYKMEQKLRCRFLYVHPVVIGILSWLVVPVANFWQYALAITFSHLIIDAIKVHFKEGVWCFIADQMAHLAIIASVAYLFHADIVLPVQMMDETITSFSIPWLIIAFLLCLKPTNILIKLILEKYEVGTGKSCDGIKNAGALIGSLERILTIVFVLLEQYEAIGFIIAAKSLLRFKETDTAKTEYVLAGTFLSFGIALLCGLLARM